MLNVLVALIGLSLFAFFAFSRRLAKSNTWQATLTPLASIMGSGFLVSAPLLAGVVGYYALPSMMILLALAYGIGSVIRFNIKHFEPMEDEPGLASQIAYLSRFVLAGAYFVSITYYLQLLAAFALKQVDVEIEFLPNIIVTTLLVAICGMGLWKGLSIMERFEKYAVSLNLGSIGALLVMLVIHNGGLIVSGEWALPAVDSGINLHDLRILLGLLIIVQGFETSRYMGSEHSAEERISSMKKAQLISALIYVVFISSATVLFHEGLGSDVTAIINLVGPIAALLPIILIVSAIVSQFTASVADTAGAGGLVGKLTNQRCSTRLTYSIIFVVTTALTWATNVNQIISYASRAFALFYSLQCVVAVVVARGDKTIKGRHLKMAFYTALAILCVLVVVVGLSSE